MSRRSTLFLCVAVVVSPALAQVPKTPASALDSRVTASPVLRVAPRHADANRPGTLAAEAAADRGRFLAGEGAGWRTVVDAASGRVALMEGKGIPWFGDPEAVSLAAARDRALAFVKAYPGLFGADAGALVLEPAASGPHGGLTFVEFRVVHGGVPVEDARVVFRLRAGRLVQVGQEFVAPSLAALDPRPAIDAAAAWRVAWAHVGGRTAADTPVGPERLLIVPVDEGGTLSYRLAHVLAFTRERVTGTWEARVDAHSGDLLSFRDVNRYGRVRGGVYVGDRPSPEVDRPLPNVDIGGGAYADGSGRFAGDAATSTLAGRYVRVLDDCGPISHATTTGDLAFGAGPGTDCQTPGLGGDGNTHAARTQAYVIDEAKARARTYLPGNAWLSATLQDNVNLGQTCNAYFSPIEGSINFFRSGDGCANTGELPGVSLHEFAHGLDANDGNGASPDDGTGETYGDLTAALFTHSSCGGAGFFGSGNCGGYGDACLACSGVREIDWDRRAMHTPVTPEMLADGGGYECRLDAGYPGPCGYEGHCESYIASEAVWDLATRDLPATGMDPATAWQLVDRLWFTTRATATSAYACPTTQTADGCGAGSLFSVFRVADDADGDLSNGTPHAAAIFAAFDRHGIACSSVNNDDQPSGCPALAAPVVTGVPSNDSVTLSWPAVPGATRYLVLRNDDGCDAGYTRVGETSGTTYVDNEPVNGVGYWYRVQPVAGGEACAGTVSACVPLMPVACRGAFALDKPVYNCSDTMSITLTDADLVGHGTQEVHVRSTAEETPEDVELVEDPPGSGRFRGSILTLASVAPGDGAIGVAHGAVVTLTYEDGDACGAGPERIERTVDADCVAPVISGLGVAATDISAAVTWATDEPATSRVIFGTGKPPGTSVTDGQYVQGHLVELGGLTSCTTYYVEVQSADAAGNVAVSNGGGTYEPFVTGGRSYVLADDVESGPGGWTVQTNQGSAFHIDSCRAVSGVNAWKAGAPEGQCPGTYASNTGTMLISAPVDLGAPGHGYHLRFREWGDTEISSYGTVRDTCTVQISVDGGTSYENLQDPYGGYSNGWFHNDIDLSGYSGPVRFRFLFESDFDWNYEGWYLDDIEVSRVVACAPEMRYDGHAVQDVCPGGGTGHGDGVVDPGEAVRLPLTLANIGPAGATLLSATVSSAHPSVTITNPRAVFPPVGPVDSTASTPPHVSVQFAPDVACGTVVPLDLHVTSEQGEWDDTFDVTVGSLAPGAPVNLVDEHFNTSATMPAGWTSEKTSGNLWNVPGFATYNCAGSTGFYLRYPVNYSQAANSWAFTPGMALQPGVTYTLAFNQRVGYSGPFDLGENLTVKLGTAPHAGNMTSELWKQSGLKNGNCTQRSVTFTVPSAGTYYIGFWCTSGAGQTEVILDDVVVSYAPTVCTVNPCTSGDLAAPGEVSNVVFTTRDALSWTAVPGADAYRVYQDRAEWCERWSGPETSTGAVLGEVLESGGSAWFLVTAVNAGGEGTAGSSSDGLPRDLGPTGICP